MLLRTLALITLSTAITTSVTNADASRRTARKNAKISAYVKVINTAAASAFENRKKLVAFESTKKAVPGCKETALSWPIASTGYTPTLYRDLAKTAKTKPKTKLDAAAKQMAAALEAMDSAQRAASKYYGGPYKKDDCQQSEKLHEGFREALTRYIEADAEIRSFVEARNAKKAAKQLNKTKRKYGQRFRYYHQKIMIDAKQVLQTVEGQPRDKPFDLELVVSAAKTFSTNIDALTPMVNKHKSKLDQFSYYRFFRLAEDLDKTIAEYLERHGPEGKPYSDYEKKQLAKGRDTVKGSFGRVINRYNRVVDVSNRLSYPPSIK